VSAHRMTISCVIASHIVPYYVHAKEPFLVALAASYGTWRSFNESQGARWTPERHIHHRSVESCTRPLQSRGIFLRELKMPTPRPQSPCKHARNHQDKAQCIWCPSWCEGSKETRTNMCLKYLRRTPDSASSWCMQLRGTRYHAKSTVTVTHAPSHPRS
jgi:hypothetical protein